MAKDSAWLCQLGGGWCGFGELCRYRGGKLDADCGGVAAWPHRATATARRRRRGDRLVTGDVRSWPIADMPKNAIDVAIGGKRSWVGALHMSANDPKRTSRVQCEM
jgi:hypothetical protein